VINTDIDRFKQIIRNLISNAIKFTDFGLVEFGFKIIINKTDSYIKFYVRDTGIGIPSGKLKVIFESFRQANESKINLFGGTGLGLAITKKMVEILGGRIWVESTPDQGSTFYFTLPYHPIALPVISTKKTIAGKDTKSYNWENKKILIVEDDDQSFIFFEKVLERTLAKIVRTNNGKDAIDLCNQSNFDLVLMDIQLPGMDGYKTTEKIKQKHPNLPVIAQTAYALSGEKNRSIEAGCDDYISKPVNIQKLLELISKHI
jgi:CheY-like chemotaxis protein